MSAPHQDPADKPRTPSAAVAFAHTPVMTATIFTWLLLTSDGMPAPMSENLVHLLPAAGAVLLASGLYLKMRDVRHPFVLSALAALASIFCVAFCLEAHAARPTGGWTLLFIAIPALLVFTALKIVARIPRDGLRLPAAMAAVAAMLLLIDGSMRYVEARGEQREASEQLLRYDTVAVLDAPGWTLTHAYASSDFPELVYRDLLGRTVLIGSTPHRLPAGQDTEESFSADVLAPEKCGTGTELPGEVRCEKRAGLLVVTMEPAYTDSELGDDEHRWPFGWTEVRTESADGRYVRLRSDAPGVDLVGLAGSIEEAAPTAPEATETSCLLRCPVWRNYS
ncbi:hypothetical protein CLV63_12593 [Murinocardiopsis flavida]|uniref:Uncharacterized protein n=1 Tax=Murinocardiopsis flavida TaxID=645275 RepID=A0A2P8CXM0_9ACTN|nr:hypothetical protein [Murinocardiopsis flavida]PSK89699.1 hypothetical protein CLV63_12593 [Murinocardiopsis flavida]